MELLKEIASVSGKSGLFKILKPTRTGVILESIDDKKTKSVANNNERISILKEISIYTTGEEASKPLEEVLKNVYATFGKELNVSGKSSDAELRAFMEKAVPDYDTEKVYCSDIKKLVIWYAILQSNFAEIFEAKKEEKKVEAPKEIKEEAVKSGEVEVITSEEKPKAKTKAKADTKKEEAEEKPKAKAKTAKK